ncbi:MAG: type I 3-dehydroquinate dehydratase [Planctomycetota bacterium]|jgi:3-dehydroquinate dehydratase/shikimate dehydrogenase|nr:type I 3-dehydroquinate dehydratase [Planctomycetota bacterium]
MICASLKAATNEELLECLSRSDREPVDLVELRLDGLEEEPLVEILVKASPRPVIAACRSRKGGGDFSGSAKARREILRTAALSGAAYVDAEPGDLEHVGGRDGLVCIASYHNCVKTPGNIAARAVKLESVPLADWVKIAVTAQTASDNLKVFAALGALKKPAIAVAGSEVGLVSSILGPRYGSKIAFGSLEKDSGPGAPQPTVRQLKELYRVEAITPQTAVFGLLTGMDSRSNRHILHNRAFADAGLDAVSIPFCVADAEDFLDSLPEALGMTLIEVEPPHRKAALSWAPAATKAAWRKGEASVLIRKPDGWLAEFRNRPVEVAGEV